MSPTRASVLLVTLLVVGSTLWAGAAAAQEDLVTMTVTVTTPAGEPVRDARVTASWDGGSSGPRSTASNGKAFLDVPSGAEVTFRVSHTEYVRNDPLVVGDATEREVSLTVHPKASATVVVEDRSGAVPEASVTLMKGGTEVVEEPTDDSGTFDSGTIEAGTYTIVVLKPGYYVQRTSADVSGDATIPITVERGTVTLEVNVTDDHFEPPAPVDEASVNVEGSGSVTTQPTGIGRISVPVNDWASIEVTKEGYRTTSESIYVGESDETLAVSVERTPELNLELLSRRVVIGERAALSVTDEYGEPVSRASILLDGEAVTETDADGRAVIPIESGGNHTVVARQGQLSSAERTVVGVDSDGEPPATTTAPSTGTATETESELPGFGVYVALLALVGAVLAGLGRRRMDR